MNLTGWLSCLALSASAVGCELPSGACTLIGCESGLIVMIQGSPSGPWRIEASAPGLETQVRECPAGSQCPSVQFEGFTPPTATITVTMGERTATSNVTLARRDVQPNGPSCEPVCNQPLVTVAPPPP
ncbi:MAG: hypothetical protein ACREOK_14015 [Gemmatimonadaceae bacterium]